MPRSPSSRRRSPHPSTRPSTRCRTPSRRSAAPSTRSSRRSRSALVGALLALLLVPASASAAEIQFFHTPSGNISCVFLKAQGERSLRCDVSNATNEAPAQPASCEFDYGFSFGLRPSGKARRLCVSDALDRGKVVPYGSSVERYGMTCRSRTSGLRCTNRSGHGFKLSRERQRLF
jgi:hypothetical protein